MTNDRRLANRFGIGRLGSFVKGTLRGRRAAEDEGYLPLQDVEAV